MRNKSRKPLDGNRSRGIGPNLNQIEVSVFGPGYGECILLHVGFNRWIIVDSCVSPSSTKPVALQYFDQIGVDCSEAVKLVVATHWHDDHIRGLGKTFKECANAEFVCSGALKQDEFLDLIGIYKQTALIEYSGVNEFRKILDELALRCEKFGKIFSPKFAISDRILWGNSLEKDGLSFDCALHSLSPSDSAVFASKLEIRNIVPMENQVLRVIPAIKVNHAAIVLWAKINEINILLGSDLEENNSYKGWSAIVDSETRPIGKAIFFKIPHHGSKNAHHPGVWEKMLAKDSHAVLTPFSKGGGLPTQKDIDRICSHTTHAYSTSLASPKKLKRTGVVEKAIKEATRKIKLMDASCGHARFRIDMENSYDLELFDDAGHICS
jgi:hypothetical protein